MTTWQARLHDRQPEIVVPTYTTLSWLEISTTTRARVDFINRAFFIQPSDLCHVNEPSPETPEKMGYQSFDRDQVARDDWVMEDR